MSPGPHQPSLQRDGVDAEVLDQAQVVVHVFQTAQHLRNKRTAVTPAITPVITPAITHFNRGADIYIYIFR